MAAVRESLRHRRLRASNRVRYELAVRRLFGADPSGLRRAFGDVMPNVLHLPPRWYRRGHHAEVSDFLPDDDAFCDEGYPPAAIEAAFAAVRASVATIGACASPAPHEWGVPADQPAPAEPLDLLTPLRPHAPDALALEEIAAALGPPLLGSLFRRPGRATVRLLLLFLVQLAVETSSKKAPRYSSLQDASEQ
jgi:hypothetical protein